MKNISKYILGTGCAMLLLASCSQILEENPKTLYTPDYFGTAAGVEGGLTALYSHLRDRYGDPYTFSDLTAGTDEATWSNGGFINNDYCSGAYVTADNAPKRGLWSFTYVNTANGIIENATANGMDESLIAEARFFRAFYYFEMVQTFGGVPLDLGSGPLKFNTSAIRSSKRNTVEEVYQQCIFPDLEYALKLIGDKPRLSGGLTKTAVRICLSRAYLTYAWWLENPKDLPTYPECTRDKSQAKTYFQKAYDLAIEGIDNPGPFGLMDHFYEIADGAHEYNKEQVFYADHTENSNQYNGSPVTGADLGSGPNYVSWFLQWNYPNMRSVASNGKTITPVYRTDNQFLGRPWERLATTHEAMKLFTDTDMDSRFDGTFTWLYRTNWNQGGQKDVEWVEGPNGNHIGLKEPFLIFYNYVDNDVIYDDEKTGFSLGRKEGVNSYVVDLRGINRNVYPGLWKQGPYRTNTNSANESGVGEQNCPSTRPFVIYKFSELYFIAAEANVKGATAQPKRSAKDLINVIRARAGQWSFKNNEQKEYIADFSKELTDKTPEIIDIDFLLDESFREYYGEEKRWFDLVRTQQWLERAQTYTITETKTTHTPVVVTRDLKELNYLTPVPQSQINAMDMSDEEKEAYQTPGYWLE